MTVILLFLVSSATFIFASGIGRNGWVLWLHVLVYLHCPVVSVICNARPGEGLKIVSVFLHRFGVTGVCLWYEVKECEGE